MFQLELTPQIGPTRIIFQGTEAECTDRLRLIVDTLNIYTPHMPHYRTYTGIIVDKVCFNILPAENNSFPQASSSAASATLSNLRSSTKGFAYHAQEPAP